MDKGANDPADKAEPEILPPEPPENGQGPAGETAILALISNYTNRPDLFLSEVEKHDPGFIKRMNALAEQHAQKLRRGKYRFGEFQAYVSLSLSFFAAIFTMLFIYLAVVNNNGFWTIIALVIFYAVSQGGRGGFLRIIKGMERAIANLRGGANG